MSKVKLEFMYVDTYKIAKNEIFISRLYYLFLHLINIYIKN